jgi:ferredoxin hydrogenase large subunit/hydrogenase large subunit
MAPNATISPLTRIEGHLAIHTDTEAIPDSKKVKITAARCEGEMFRGIETIMQGRDPLDAQQITQRICGVCPIAHGMASLIAQEMAYGIEPTRNGRIAQNLIFGANYLQSHILHFYHLSALDFVDIKAILKYNGSNTGLKSLSSWVENAVASNSVFPAAPFLPRYEVNQYLANDEANWQLIGSYVCALKMRTIAHEMCAIFAAKMPHSTSLVPSGVTGEVTMERILCYKSRLDKLTEFVETVYLPDLLLAAKAFGDYWNIGASYGNYLSFGNFRMEEKTGLDVRKWMPSGVIINGKLESLNPDKIQEFVSHSHYSSNSGLHPYDGQTTPAPDKGYSWLKAPRYGGEVMEVGPLARVMVAYMTPGYEWVKKEVDSVLASAQLTGDKLNSVLGRHLARGLETKWLVGQLNVWLDELEIGKPMAREFTIPKTGKGFGLVEAERGALGHWLTIENYKVKNYQCIVPTTWNCSARDDSNKPGAVEKALEGTILEDPQQPIEAGRIVRSFDPCIACAVH